MTEKVKRYKSGKLLDDPLYGVFEDEQGEYVKYQDYAQLEIENRLLQEKLEVTSCDDCTKGTRVKKLEKIALFARIFVDEWSSNHANYVEPETVITLDEALKELNDE